MPNAKTKAVKPKYSGNAVPINSVRRSGIVAGGANFRLQPLMRVLASGGAE